MRHGSGVVTLAEPDSGNWHYLDVCYTPFLQILSLLVCACVGVCVWACGNAVIYLYLRAILGACIHVHVLTCMHTQTLFCIMYMIHQHHYKILMLTHAHTKGLAQLLADGSSEDQRKWAQVWFKDSPARPQVCLSPPYLRILLLVTGHASINGCLVSAHDFWRECLVSAHDFWRE
jgi:hypothetical protein